MPEYSGIAYQPRIKKPRFSATSWKAYQAVIPDEQQRPVAKETGETAHVNRWNNTLRYTLNHKKVNLFILSSMVT